MNEEVKVIVEPDYVAVCDFLTFTGGTLPTALRKLADYVEQNSAENGGFIEEYCVEFIQVAHCDAVCDEVFRVSMHGDWEGETTIKELKEN